MKPWIASFYWNVWLKSTQHAIKRMNSSNVVAMKLQIRFVSQISRVHDGILHAGMPKTKIAANLMNSHVKQVGALLGEVSESFSLVKMKSTIGWRERMRQDSTFSIKWVTTRLFCRSDFVCSRAKAGDELNQSVLCWLRCPWQEPIATHLRLKFRDNSEIRAYMKLY